MKIERTRNTVRSVVSGGALRIINTILPFVSRTVILYVLGEKYLGLSSLFSSILSFLSLADLGMGSAMVYSMYKPIAENDTQTVSALLNLYRRFFRIIGCVILTLGIGLMPFLDYLIKGEVPEDINLYLLYLLYLGNAVLSYFLFAYKQSILQAYQRNDVESKIGMVVTPVSYIVMLVCLLITKNYYAYVIWVPIFTIVTNIARMVYVDRHYPHLKPQGEISKELRTSISKKVRALIGTKLNTVVLNAADNIVMSVFLGLTTVAVYGNYYYVMSTVIGFAGLAYGAMTAGIGNSLQTESEEKNYQDFLKFSFINAWMVGWCTVCMVCLYQPFMNLWVGETLMFPTIIAMQFGLYFYIYMIRKIPVTYKDAAGIWWEDRFRPYVCMVVNLILNVVLVKYIGISGIILSTVFSLIISIPWENYTIFRYVFHRGAREYYGKMLSYAVAMALGGAVTYGLCSLLGQGIWQLFARLGICVVIPNVVFWACHRKRAECRGAKTMALRIIKRNY